MAVTYKDLEFYIKNKKTFRINTLVGKYHNFNNQLLFFSYDTLIAILDTNTNQCYIIDKKYSSTTSRHKNLIAHACDNIKFLTIDDFISLFPSLSKNDFDMNKKYNYGEFQGRWKTWIKLVLIKLLL